MFPIVRVKSRAALFGRIGCDLGVRVGVILVYLAATRGNFKKEIEDTSRIEPSLESRRTQRYRSDVSRAPSYVIYSHITL